MNAVQIGDRVKGSKEYETSKGSWVLNYTGRVISINNGLARVRTAEQGEFVQFTHRLTVVARG